MIARLVQTSEDRVREVIHNFNRLGLVCLDPKWAGGRPRRITTDDEGFIVATATARSEKLGRPFTGWRSASWLSTWGTTGCAGCTSAGNGCASYSPSMT